MKYLLILILLFSSCNVAKKIFRHKETSVIQLKKDSTGTTNTHVDTGRQSSVRVIESTDIVKPGTNKKVSSELDLDLLKSGPEREASYHCLTGFCRQFNGHHIQQPGYDE